MIERGRRYSIESRPPHGFRRHIIQTRQPLVINQEMERLAAEFDNPNLAGENVKSWVGVQMIIGDEVTGIVSLQNLDQEDAFPESDVHLLTTLTASLSVSLENARLFA